MKIEKMDGSQLWDVFVGSQTVEEFMSFPPNSTPAVAVDDYIEAGNLEVMFGVRYGEETIAHIRNGILSYINKMLEE